LTQLNLNLVSRVYTRCYLYNSR